MYPAVERFGISSRYGPRPNLMGDFHYGTDIPCPVGTDLVAITDGVVARAGNITFTYGGKKYTETVLVVNRPDGRFNIYDHLSQVLVKEGQEVRKGQLVARSGQSGYVTGPHWHCQKGIGQYKKGTAFASYKTEDPEPELRAWTLQGGGDEVTQTEHDKQMNDLRRFYEAVIVDTFIALLAQQDPGKYPADARQHHIDYITHNVGGQIQVGQGFIDAYGWKSGSQVAAIQKSADDAMATVKDLQAKVADAPIQTFRECWITRAQVWPSKKTIDDWQHTTEAAYTYVQLHAPSPTETDLGRQLEQTTKNNTDLHVELERQDKLIEGLNAQIAALKDGKPADDVEVPEVPEQPVNGSNQGIWEEIIDLIENLLKGGKR